MYFDPCLSTQFSIPARPNTSAICHACSCVSQSHRGVFYCQIAQFFVVQPAIVLGKPLPFHNRISLHGQQYIGKAECDSHHPKNS